MRILDHAYLITLLAAYHNGLKAVVGMEPPSYECPYRNNTDLQAAWQYGVKVGLRDELDKIHNDLVRKSDVHEIE